MTEKKLGGRRFHASAFLIPLVLCLVGFIALRLRPFGGGNTLIAFDAWGQYYPMLRQFLRDPFGSFSFSGGLLSDLAAQRAYYCRSPLWFLLFAFKKDPVVGVHLISALRFGLSGLCFSFWCKRRDLWGLTACAAYAFCGFATAFMNQFLWMDAWVLLPLLCLGLRKLHEGKKPWLYFICLALVIFSNFYIAWPVCVFLVFFACFMQLEKREKGFFLRFILWSAAAGAVCSPVLYRAARAVLAAKSASMGFSGGLAFYHGPLAVLRMLLPANQPSLGYGAPNLYFGLIFALAAMCVLFSKKSLAHKLIFIGFFVFMLVSADLNILDYFWHGLHFPNQLPGRWSFIFAFWGLSAALDGFDALPDTLKKAALVLAAVEVVFASQWGIMHAYTVPYFRIEPWSAETADFSSLGEGFYRCEIVPQRDNGGMLYGYNGISYYSSTMAAEDYDFFRRLGYGVYAQNVSVRYRPYRETDAVFGVRYLLSETDVPGWTLLEERGGRMLLENPNALGICFYAHPDADRTVSGEGRAFRVGLFRALTGGLYFNEGIAYLKSTQIELSLVTPGRVEGSFTADREGILVFSLPARGASVTVDGRPAEIVRVGGWLCGVRTGAGEHEFCLRY